MTQGRYAYSARGGSTANRAPESGLGIFGAGIPRMEFVRLGLIELVDPSILPSEGYQSVWGCTMDNK